jgi:hypothetical protein
MNYIGKEISIKNGAVTRKGIVTEKVDAYIVKSENGKTFLVTENELKNMFPEKKEIENKKTVLNNNIVYYKIDSCKEFQYISMELHSSKISFSLKLIDNIGNVYLKFDYVFFEHSRYNAFIVPVKLTNIKKLTNETICLIKWFFNEYFQKEIFFVEDN